MELKNEGQLGDLTLPALPLADPIPPDLTLPVSKPVTHAGGAVPKGQTDSKARGFNPGKLVPTTRERPEGA